MIDPRIEMTDLDPEGFGIVCALASRALRVPRTEVHVRHRDGIVTRAIHTVDGPLETLHGRTLSPARELRETLGVGRAILVDEARLGDLAHTLAAAGQAATQDEMIVRSRRAFLDAEGVDVDPPPADGMWDRWAGHVRSLGDSYVALVAGYENDACVFNLLGFVDAGLLRRVTSLPNDTPDLVAAAGEYGTVRLAVLADVGAFRDALEARSLAPLRQRAAFHLGLPDDIP